MSITHLPFLFSHISLYVIQTPHGPVLIDTGLPGMSRWIMHKLMRAGVRPKELAGVVLTHCHLDHAGSARAFQRLGVPLLAHHLEVPILHGQSPQPGYGDNLAGKALRLVQNMTPQPAPFSDVSALHDQEPIFGSPWKVFPAPGHSPGSLALWNSQTGDLITGDTLVTAYGRPSGPHPVYTADLPVALASARALLDLEPKRICPGHGRMVEAGRFEKLKFELSTTHIPCMSPGG